MKSKASSTHLNLIIALIAVSLIGIATICAGWYFILGVSNDANKLNTETLNLTDETSRLSTLQIQLRKVLPQQDLVYQAIPKSKDVSSFLATIESLANSHGIKINSEQVGDALIKSKTGSDFSQAVKVQQYYQLPVHYDVSGNYADVQALIKDFSETRRLSTVTNLTVMADYTDTSSQTKVKATFIAYIYVQK